MMLKELAKVTELSPRLHEVLNMTMCLDKTTDCVDRACDKCGVENLSMMFEEIEDKDVSFHQWIKTDKQMTKKELIKSISEAKEMFYNQLEKLARHDYNASKQHAVMREMKLNLGNGEIILHEDFSENYLIKQQNEVMSAHFGTNTSVTVFTAIAYYNSDSELKHRSYSIVSDDPSHVSQNVYAYNSVLIDDLKANLPFSLKHIHYWSDGAVSQFKNRNMVNNLLYHERDYGITADWNFFGTAHGKGPIDGIGGETKRSVWRATLKGKVVVNNAHEFYSAAKQFTQKINVLYVSSQDVKMNTSHLDVRWQKAKPVKGIAQHHYFEPKDESTIRMQINKGENNSITLYLGDDQDQQENQSDSLLVNEAAGSSPSASFQNHLEILVGDIVAVAYEDGLDIGEVLKNNGHEIEAKFMVACKQKSIFKQGGDVRLVNRVFIYDKVDSANMVPANNGRAIKITNYDELKTKFDAFYEQYF